ncbi:MAG: hypothetical protein IJ192_00640 [Clostridia bacterium]|nr:hypothetical protein [Clostridia bacterium]MBR2176123.1 hypothetical protein [Clostridia bacterium]
MSAETGVYPCYKNQFKIGSAGATTLNTIADMESFSVSFDDGVEEWTPFEGEGWTRRLKTAKSITISVSGKRNVGDAGNDFVAGLAFKNGRDAEADFEWLFPDGTKVKFADAIINISALGSSDSTGVAPLEFEVMSNGKPTVTEPTGT